MVRFKQRYLLVTVHSDRTDLTQKDIYAAVSGQVNQVMGVYGYGCVRATLQIKYHNAQTATFILRVGRQFLRSVWLAVSSVKEVAGRTASLEVVHVGGTLRTVKRALLLSRQQQQALGTLMNKGVSFEHFAVSCLNSRVRGLAVSHCGGRLDGGVDFAGSWLLEVPVPVVGQCKRHVRRIGPGPVRELQAVAASSFALLVSASGFSREALSWADAPATSAPMLLMALDPLSGRVGRLALNRAAKEMHPRLAVASELGDEGRSPVLLFDGSVVLRGT